MSGEPAPTAAAAAGLARVMEVIDRLLDPEQGCPWDRKQTPGSIAGYILEEVHELLEAVRGELPDATAEEMGDCLFLLCFLARLHADRGDFHLADALNAAADKMIHRHPHVFENTHDLETAEDVRQRWHEIKRAEKPQSLIGIGARLAAGAHAHPPDHGTRGTGGL